MPCFSACFSGPMMDDIQPDSAAGWPSNLTAETAIAPLQLWLKAPTFQLAQTFCHMVANGRDVQCQEADPMHQLPVGGELDQGIDILLDYDGMPVQHRDSPIINALCHNLPPLNEHALFAHEFTRMLSDAGYGSVQIEAAMSLLDGRADPEHTAAGHSAQRHKWDRQHLLKEALNEVLWLYGVIHLPEYEFSYLETSGRYAQTLCWYQDQLFCCAAEPMLERITDWHQNVLGLQQEGSMLARVLQKREPSWPGKLYPASVCPKAWQLYQQEQTEELFDEEWMMASAS